MSQHLQEHPDFLHEFERLQFTKRYLQAVIKTAQTSKDQFQENMKEAFADADWLESSMAYGALLTNALFFDMSKDELNSLMKARYNPYFARIDFLRDGQSQHEVMYIGKTSLYSRENQEQIIVDWRSPIANLYYEGRLGDVEYHAYGKDYKGHLSLKRQIMIEEGELKELRDIDLTTTDELLQESLAKSSNNRLTEIITTIQEEQNRIIRADLNKPIIVQGGAGSGKTTIALHRISYFIYQFKENFQPEQLMIIAPSGLFLHYIAEALPELGVERIRQTTFQDYVLKCLALPLQVIADDKLVKVIEAEDQQEVLTTGKASSLKGSEAFQTIIANYVKKISSAFLPDKDFYVDKFRLFSRKKFISLFQEDYQYLPIYRRIDKLKAILQNDVRIKKKQMLQKIEQYYDERIEKALYRGKDAEKRRRYVTEALDKKDERMKAIKGSIRNAVNQYMSQFPRKKLLDHYHQLFTDPKELVRLSENRISKAEAEQMCTYSTAQFKKKKYEREDLALLLFLQVQLYGIDKEHRAKNIVIDEAQDYSFMELLALKRANDTDMFTLVGDLAQGIHSYRSIASWETVVSKILPRATYAELQKSYRTTVEIMESANNVIAMLPQKFPAVNPVVRHGEPPQFIIRQDDAAFVEQLEKRVEQLRGEGYKTFAMIGKTMNDCRKLQQLFQQHSSESVTLLEERDTIPKDQVVIVPTYLVKGLEFDAVIIFSLEEQYERNSELDLKLLYVAMTRPLHRLYFYGKSKEEFLLP